MEDEWFVDKFMEIKQDIGEIKSDVRELKDCQRGQGKRIKKLENEKNGIGKKWVALFTAIATGLSACAATVVAVLSR